MIWIAAFMGGLGIVCMISRDTFLGLLIGLQILVLGGTMMFVLAGLKSGLKIEGYIFGLFVILGGVVQLTVGYALAIRLFFLKKQISIKQLQALKR